MSTLSAAQHQAIELLAMRKSQKDVADILGVTPKTIYKWKQIVEFQWELRQRAKEALRDTVNNLQITSSDAVETLAEVMRNEDAPANVRIDAASKILTHTNKYTETYDLLEEIQELKKQAQNELSSSGDKQLQETVIPPESPHEE